MRVGGSSEKFEEFLFLLNLANWKEIFLCLNIKKLWFQRGVTRLNV